MRVHSYTRRGIKSKAKHQILITGIRFAINRLPLFHRRGLPHRAGHLRNRCSAGSRPALVTPLLLIGKAEQLSALHLSRLIWVALRRFDVDCLILKQSG